MTILINHKDKQGQPLFAIDLSNQIFDAILLPSTDTVLAVPANARFAIIKASDDFFVSSSLITLTTSNSFQPAGALLNAPAIYIYNLTSLHFLTNSLTNVYINVAFYQ